MSSGNRELDSIIDWLAMRERGRLTDGDARKLRYVGRLMQSGITDMQRARRLLGDLIEEVEDRAAQEKRPTGRRKND